MELYTRSAVKTSVDMDGRTIDVFAVPYNSPNEVTDRHGTYVETFYPGAFGNVGARANRVKVLRDHSETRVIGRCRSIAPNRADGLHASLYVSRTPLGDESLELARDEILDVSVGFTPLTGANNALTKTRADWRGVYLREISLVPFPAYEDARVLAVRSAELAGAVLDEPPAPAGSPRLDEIRGWLLQYRSDAATMRH